MLIQLKQDIVTSLLKKQWQPTFNSLGEIICITLPLSDKVCVNYFGRDKLSFTGFSRPDLDVDLLDSDRSILQQMLEQERVKNSSRVFSSERDMFQTVIDELLESFLKS